MDKIQPILDAVDGVKYIKKERVWIIDPQSANDLIGENLDLEYGADGEAESILIRVGRQIKDFVLGPQLTYVDDFEKKEYLYATVEANVRVLKDIMIRHLESTVLVRRDLLLLEHGVDLDANALIQDFDKHMDTEYAFSKQTRETMNRRRIFKYKERVDQVITDLGVGY